MLVIGQTLITAAAKVVKAASSSVTKLTWAVVAKVDYVLFKNKAYYVISDIIPSIPTLPFKEMKKSDGTVIGKVFNVKAPCQFGGGERVARVSFANYVTDTSQSWPAAIACGDHLLVEISDNSVTDSTVNVHKINKDKSGPVRLGTNMWKGRLVLDGTVYTVKVQITEPADDNAVTTAPEVSEEELAALAAELGIV